MRAEDPKVRAEIFKAAEKKFAESGYAGTSVQDIIDATKYSKPVLYYHFDSKAGIYKALVDYAYDECYRLMQEAIQRSEELNEQLIEILTALFEFMRKRRNLSRIAFATAFAAKGELPDDLGHLEKGKRNFELVYGIIETARKAGRLDASFNVLELAYRIYGALTFHLMADVLEPKADGSRKARKESCVSS